MEYTIRVASPSPAPFTRRPRRGGVAAIDQVQIHATRGSTTMDRQVQAAENHFAYQVNRGGWGSSAEYAVGPDRRIGGRIAIVRFGDWRTTYSSWSAGYGARLPLGRYEYGAAERGIAIEVAQPPRRDLGRYLSGDSDVPFTPATVAAVAWLCRRLNHVLVAAGGTAIPAVRIASWDQLRSRPVPRGYIGHEDLANGKKLGKSDVGAMWPWPQFLALLRRTPGLDSAKLLTRITAAERELQAMRAQIEATGDLP